MNRASPTKWDDIELPPEIGAEPKQFDPWAAAAYPHDDQHDFILWTDGSGHQSGWGAYASIFLENASGLHDVRMAGTYGSTTRRMEMQALLEGMHAILDFRLRELARTGDYDESKPIHALTGNGRITVAWYTDRRELAMSLVFRPDGSPVFDRKKDKDLWASFMSMQRFFCITPRPRPRNAEKKQELCDAMCSTMRMAVKRTGEQLQKVTSELLPSELWGLNLKRPQSAVF